jgi:hypothetical protein
MKSLFVLILFSAFGIFPNSVLAAKRVTGYGYGFLSTSYMGYFLRNTRQSITCDSNCSTDSAQAGPVDLYFGSRSVQGASFQLAGTLDPDFLVGLEYSFFKNKYSFSPDSDLYGYVKTQHFLLNFQSNINITGPLRFYIGVGVGHSRTEFSGAIHRKVSGFMYSGEIGMVYLLNHDIGLFTETQYSQTSSHVASVYNTKGYAVLLGTRLFFNGRK